jgi:hypothetical protein
MGFLVVGCLINQKGIIQVLDLGSVTLLEVPEVEHFDTLGELEQLVSPLPTGFLTGLVGVLDDADGFPCEVVMKAGVDPRFGTQHGDSVCVCFPFLTPDELKRCKEIWPAFDQQNVPMLRPQGSQADGPAGGRTLQIQCLWTRAFEKLGAVEVSLLGDMLLCVCDNPLNSRVAAFNDYA